MLGPHRLRCKSKGLAGRYSSRPLLEIAPPMDCLDIFGAVVSPSPSHAFGFDVVGHDFAVMREGCVADCTPPILLNDLSVQQLSYFGW